MVCARRSAPPPPPPPGSGLAIARVMSVRAEVFCVGEGLFDGRGESSNASADRSCMPAASSRACDPDLAIGEGGHAAGASSLPRALSAKSIELARLG